MDLLKIRLELWLGFVGKKHKVNSGVQLLDYSWLLVGDIIIIVFLIISDLVLILD
jgi:hypothetical protein